MKWVKVIFVFLSTFNGMRICLHFKGLFFHEFVIYFFAKSMYVRDNFVVYLLQLCVRGEDPIFIFYLAFILFIL